MPEQDPYVILGVPPTATDQEIRKAYISRCKVLHPDRFDPKTQPKEWAQANEMHAELNRAYATLRNANQRSGADAPASATQGQAASPNSTPATPPAPHRSKRPFIDGRVILGMLVLGFWGLYLGATSLWRESGIDKVPHHLSLTELRDGTVPNNRLLKVSDAECDLGHGVAYLEHYTPQAYYIPLVTPSAQPESETPPAGRRIILRLTKKLYDAHSGDLQNAGAPLTVEGIRLLNADIESRIEEFLKKELGIANLDNVVVIDGGRQPIGSLLPIKVLIISAAWLLMLFFNFAKKPKLAWSAIAVLCGAFAIVPDRLWLEPDYESPLVSQAAKTATHASRLNVVGESTSSGSSSTAPATPPEKARAEKEAMMGDFNISEEDRIRFEKRRKAAEQGDTQAQLDVGNMYLGGIGVAKNAIEAVKWYRMGAEQGHKFCQMTLAVMYETGEEIPRDVAEVVKWYRKLAEKGEVHYAYKLGEKYRMGEGVPKDAAESVKWYRMGAEQGHDLCQTILGNMYADGVGVSKDATEAARWYRKAAAEGNSLGRSIAQGDLGRLFARGEVLPKDSAEAVTCYRKAAEYGDAIAQRKLADRYSRGDGVPKNGAEAAMWYRKAAESGDAIAQNILGSMYVIGVAVAKDPVEAVKWLRKAAEKENVEAQLLLGAMYESGEGVPKDELEALAWYYIAAASGNVDASERRKLAEARLGQKLSLLAQQRSKEIVRTLQAAKTKSTGITQSEQPREWDTEKAPSMGQSGTGVFVTADGLILTAAHVVKSVSSIQIQTSHGVKPGRLVKVDTKNDLALIKCEGKFPSVPIKASRDVKLGQAVFTIGFPNVELQGVSPKMTRGEISSLAGLQDDPRQWQISVPLQPGNSGGPLFDEAGNVIGVIVAKLNAIKAAKFTGDLSQNVNYAVKSAPALQLLAPYSEKLARERQVNPSDKVETVVEQCRESVVLIFGYGP
jgi:TPR repeat protein